MWLFVVLYLDIKIENKSKWMLNVRLAGVHLYGKSLFTWLLLVMSLIMSYFVLYFFQQDVLDEIWD